MYESNYVKSKHFFYLFHSSIILIYNTNAYQNINYLPSGHIKIIFRFSSRPASLKVASPNVFYLKKNVGNCEEKNWAQ